MKSSKDCNINNNSQQSKTLFDFSSNHKILPANNIDKKTLLIRPNNIRIDKLTREIAETKSVNNNKSIHLSPSPYKKNAYIQSLKDKIFSPGDGTSEKNQSKNLALISELSKKLLSSPLLTKTSDQQQPKAKSIPIGNSNPSPIPPQSSSLCQQAPLKYLPEKSYYNLHHKTLILDLDETLVHSNFKSFYAKSDIVLNIPFDEKNHTIHVLKRPYVDEFLDKMSKIYELVIFTASIPEYANPLLNKLDTNKRISSRLFREHCTTSNNLFIKDLRKVGRNLKDTILLDNNPVSYALNKENGLPILTWHSNKGDTELLKLIPLLEHLSKVDDVRDVIKKVVSGNYLNYNEINRFINPKEEEKNNHILNNTINYGLNNGATSAPNCSMNLFSHHFSSIYFDEKEREKEKEKEKKQHEKEIESFNNCFDTKKNNIIGGASVFEDKKYQEKYDRFYDSKGLNSDEFIKKELNEQIILPSNTSCHYRDREKNKFTNVYNNNNNMNRAHSAVNQDDQYTFIKGNNNNNTNDYVSNYGTNSTNNTYQKSNYANPKKDTSYDTNSKLNSLKFERNKLDFYQGAITGSKATQATNHFTKKATISLQDQQSSPIISHNLSALNQLSNWEFNIHPIKSCFGLVIDSKNTSAKDSTTTIQSKSRTISQTLREKEKNNNSVKQQMF